MVAADDTTLSTEEFRSGRLDIGHVRPQSDERFAGVVNGIPSSGGCEISGDTPYEAIDDGLVAAHRLGWLLPEAAGPDAAGAYLLTGVEPDPPGRGITK
jgi:hypothetical protein